MAADLLKLDRLNFFKETFNILACAEVPFY